jgi:hypothetical protein
VGLVLEYLHLILMRLLRRGRKGNDEGEVLVG